MLFWVFYEFRYLAKQPFGGGREGSSGFESFCSGVVNGASNRVGNVINGILGGNGDRQDTSSETWSEVSLSDTLSNGSLDEPLMDSDEESQPVKYSLPKRAEGCFNRLFCNMLACGDEYCKGVESQLGEIWGLKIDPIVEGVINLAKFECGMRLIAPSYAEAMPYIRYSMIALPVLGLVRQAVLAHFANSTFSRIQAVSNYTFNFTAHVVAAVFNAVIYGCEKIYNFQNCVRFCPNILKAFNVSRLLIYYLIIAGLPSLFFNGVGVVNNVITEWPAHNPSPSSMAMEGNWPFGMVWTRASSYCPNVVTWQEASEVEHPEGAVAASGQSSVIWNYSELLKNEAAFGLPEGHIKRSVEDAADTISKDTPWTVTLIDQGKCLSSDVCFDVGDQMQSPVVVVGNLVQFNPLPNSLRSAWYNSYLGGSGGVAEVKWDYFDVKLKNIIHFGFLGTRGISWEELSAQSSFNIVTPYPEVSSAVTTPWGYLPELTLQTIEAAAKKYNPTRRVGVIPENNVFCAEWQYASWLYSQGRKCRDSAERCTKIV